MRPLEIRLARARGVQRLTERLPQRLARSGLDLGDHPLPLARGPGELQQQDGLPHTAESVQHHGLGGATGSHPLDGDAPGLLLSVTAHQGRRRTTGSRGVWVVHKVHEAMGVARTRRV